MYYLTKTVTDPYALLLLLTGLILLFGLWKTEPRYRWIKIALLLWVSLFLLSTPLASQGLLGSLESQHPKTEELPEKVDAIIVMGAGVIPPTDEETETLLTTHSRERCRHALRLFNKLDHPVIILCGSKVLEEALGKSEAETMKQYLIAQGVSKDHLLVEDGSANTFESIQNASKIVIERKAENVLLVTHAYHLHRTILCCQKQELKVTPSGCGYRSKKMRNPWYTDILPSTDSFSKSSRAIHEWVGIAWYQMTGKL